MDKTNVWILAGIITMMLSCNEGQPPKEEANAEVKTPVSVTSITDTTLTDYLELNATSVFLQNNYIKSNVNGYIKVVNAHPGQYVNQGWFLFSIQTKESLAIGNSISQLDSSFKFSGISNIKASMHGYITQLNHQVGDYVLDGEQLAVISDRNSFAFILNLPYELRPYVVNKKNVEIILPDNTKLPGFIFSVMPTVDSASQTQNVVIRVNTKEAIPQNLIAKVRIIKTTKEHAFILPKTAVLANDSQTSFWVMKMIDSATAIRVEVKKGMEIKDRVEILNPHFSLSDQILISGNYGLPDTAKVTVVKE